MVAADFASYLGTQGRIAELWRNKPEDWRRKAIMNTAGAGWFTSDRTIRQYAEEIWGVPAAQRAG